MRNEIVKNKEFYIISRSIDNADLCSVIDTEEDCFTVKLQHNKKYEQDESVELFTMTPKGQLYFETIIKEVNNDNLSIWFPITYKYLQRREYSRIQINKTIELKDNEHLISAEIIDISAGGVKLSTSEMLNLLKSYEININIGNKIINTIFEPVRIEAEENKFISSGRFKNIDNYNRILLVQYCFGKQIENKYK